MTKRVLILVTHLLGAGHLTRATALARAFAKTGHPTTLVSGGMPASVTVPDDITFIQLPPVQTRGTDFSTLLDDQGLPVTQAFLSSRCNQLVETVRRARPDVLITELFPFGRRVLASEFTAVLRDAHLMRPRPLILSSIRDILVAPTKPERITQAVTRIEDFYDAVLVHGDPALAPLEASWPVDERLRPFLRYTGYVDEGAVPALSPHRRGIVVSGGSSAASLPLYRAALDAAQIIADRSWYVLVGRGIVDGEYHALQQTAPPHVSVERARPDFRQLLTSAELSVSQAGYNTCVDILRSGVRSILVPFEAGHETEQRLRAECLQDAGFAQVLPEAALNAQSLADAITVLLASPAPPSPSIALDGAARSVSIAEELALSRPALLSSPIDWTALDEALALSRGRGREPVMWWRDDDAVADSPELNRLLQLANRIDAGLALAVIPQRVDPSLAHRLRDEARVSILVHGYTHTNYSPTGGKKAEFGPDRDLATMEREVRAALRGLGRVFDEKLLGVFVPPWNRISPALVPTLADAGYVGLSTFRDRKATYPVPGLLQINTHIDPIDWHGTRSLADVPACITEVAAAVSRRAFAPQEGEPIGFLTHHLVHDERVWGFCEELLLFLARKGLQFALARKLFCDKSGNVVEL